MLALFIWDECKILILKESCQFPLTVEVNSNTLTVAKGGKLIDKGLMRFYPHLELAYPDSRTGDPSHQCPTERYVWVQLNRRLGRGWGGAEGGGGKACNNDIAIITITYMIGASHTRSLSATLSSTFFLILKFSFLSLLIVYLLQLECKILKCKDLESLLSPRPRTILNIS